MARDHIRVMNEIHLDSAGVERLTRRLILCAASAMIERQPSEQPK